MLRILAEGPATTAEIVAETGWSRKNVCARAISLMGRGMVTRKPYSANGQQSRFLWSIAPGVDQKTACFEKAVERAW